MDPSSDVGAGGPLTRRRFSQGLLAGAAGLASCAGIGGGGFESLDAIARRKGMRVGNAIGIAASGSRSSSRFHDPAYRALTARECSLVVAENETKWQALRPDPRQPYRFGPADEIFAWASAQGMGLRGHTLAWVDPKWMPAWVNRHEFGARPALEAERLLAEHVGTVCRHFGSAIESWDVVNEAIDPDSGSLRQNVFTRHLGGVEFIQRLFELAREHAPQAQLVYNDYMNWGGGASSRHRAGVLKLLAELKSRGAPVQALGLQSHIGGGPLPAGGREDAGNVREWRRFLDEVTGMGLDLLITEFDVNDRYLPAPIAERDAAVAALAREWLDVTLAQPRLKRFLLWGLADHYSWLQDGWPRADGLSKRPAPYDAQLQPKPLRQAIADALRAMPERSA